MSVTEPRTQNCPLVVAGTVELKLSVQVVPPINVADAFGASIGIQVEEPVVEHRMGLEMPLRRQRLGIDRERVPSRSGWIAG